ncbi:MAG: proton-conducting transporter membrane subunit, partial [Candidatus Thermoplasmatota archaeon]|nr:proton-conducting transporter membrane subunit [Candidatus Thermoplasmatota archaeon]
MSISQFFVDNTAILVVALPLLAAFLTPLLGKLSKNAPRYFTTLVLMVAAGLVVLLAWNVWTNGPVTYTLGSSAHTIFRIQLFVDGFGVFMALIMSAVAIAASIYSWNHMERYSSQEKYYTLLLLVVVGSYGMVFTYDIFNLFVFFEISSISLCALVAFRTERGESFEAAFKYMLYSTIAGVFLLFAIGIFYGQYGVLNIGGISDAMGAAGGASLLDKVGLGLLITVFTLKAGTVPMHMATPDAYGESPAGITALFVAGSQAGLYALFRTSFTMFGPNLNPTNIGWLLIVLGVMSMFVGVTMALKQRDIKRVIAYSGIAQVGYVLMAFGVGMTAMADPATMASYGFTAFRGGMFHILNYALYESLLFLAAGAIIYRAGTRDMDKMGGLGHSMKVTSMIFLLGTLAVAGIPPLAGFSSKLLIYQSVYAVNPLLAAIAMMVSVLTLAAFIKVFYAAFTGPRPAKKVLPAPPSMVFGMGLLTLIVL